jgi:hypothetical protein
MSTQPDFGYSHVQNDLIEEVRGFLNKNQTNIDLNTKKFKRAVQKQWFALVAEFAVFLSVMLWSAYRVVGNDADGVAVWGYATSGIVMAVFVSVLAPLCTMVSTPLRDGRGKIRMVAITAWLGMLLVWFPSVMEFISQTSLESRVIDKFGLESEWHWVVSLVLFVLGLALFSVFNHIYRDAKQREKELAENNAACQEAVHLDAAVTGLEESLERVAQMERDEKEWVELSAKVTPDSAKAMAQALYRAEISKRHRLLLDNPPHPHTSKQTRAEHQAQLKSLESLLSQPSTEPKELP